MNKAAFLSLLTASLALSGAQQQHALDTWADKYIPELTDKALACLSGPFSFGEVGDLAEAAVRAAQDLKGIFAGTQRAEIAQVVLVASVKAVLPDDAEHWVLPLLESDVVEGIIEAAFRRVFGPQAQGAPPVVDAPEVEPGGIQ